MIDLPPPTYQQTIEAVARCDIPRANVGVAYKDYLQSDEVTISDVGELTDQKLLCLKAAVHPFYILTIENEVQQAAYYRLLRVEDRPVERKEAQEWLRSRGLLDSIPKFDPKQGVGEFAEALETACGLRRGTALMRLGASSLTVRPDFFSSRTFKKSADALHCLTRMFTASDAQENGLNFGFVGNEAFLKGDEE